MFSRRSSRTVRKRKISTAQRSGRTRSSARWLPPLSIERILEHLEVRDELVGIGVIGGAGELAALLLRDRRLELAQHAGRGTGDRARRDCAARSARPRRFRAKARASTPWNAAGGGSTRSVIDSRCSRTCKALLVMAQARRARSACSARRVTSLMTKGLPSRSPPIQEPNWNNGVEREALARIIIARARGRASSKARGRRRTTSRGKNAGPRRLPARPTAFRDAVRRSSTSSSISSRSWSIERRAFPLGPARLLQLDEQPVDAADAFRAR